MAQAKGSLTLDTLPKNIIKAEYAVRGEVSIKATEIQQKLTEGNHKYAFNELIPANIGNPQAVGQQPLTFPRQVLACVICPQLLQNNNNIFPNDVITRAKKYLDYLDQKAGAYTHSMGVLGLRKEVSHWLLQRDGITASHNNIFFTDGASSGVKITLELLIRDDRDAVMIPRPQYPLYSATLARLGGACVEYSLKEQSAWGLDVQELKSKIKETRDRGLNLRGLAVINPGNPTGGVLSRQDIEDVLRLCESEGIVLLFDEVYQANVYLSDCEFIPSRKVMNEIGSKVELFTFHSASKGLTGECGLRGGLMIADNIDNDVLGQIYKLCSINLCSNTIGQVAMVLCLYPPVEGGESYDVYKKECEGIYLSLQRKAKRLADSLNLIDGISCQPVAGAMYAFPMISLPSGAVSAASQINKSPDLMYCLELLEATGIVVVPGSGFGQAEGTYHFRTTILPCESKFDQILNSIKKFHESFVNKYK
eukprot:GHVR01191222.1.p1 GENE.GHVR01191222.1~~GHVR01191222.1.p1  ORF type:complete len:479 (+),score=110.42 GHVR01191222.1:46-1482(+)